MDRIEITLLSDMCAASGEGYSHTIDTDVCYDHYGLPYIPARRLKGCLREAAIYIGISDSVIDRIFGVTGTSEGSMRLGNGLLRDYDKLAEEIKDCFSFVFQQDILDLFTCTRISTEINDESGVAKDDSMHSVRAVNRLLPYRNENTVFVFSCECPAADHDELKRICKALRRMGANRNRGMGEVSCAFIPGGEAEKPAVWAEILGNGRARMNLKLTFQDPVLLPAPDNNACSRYISGTAMLGALASMYLRSGGSADTLFDRLFLNGEVTYGNFYIAGAIPAPAYVGKLKSPNGNADGTIVSRFADFQDGEAKILRNGFVSKDLREVKVQTESIFHHNPKQNLLYTQEAVSAGQAFLGSIEGPKDLIEILTKLLNAGTLRIGRSKTAQYARVDVESEHDAALTEEKIVVEKDNCFAVSLVSDVILTDAYGRDVTDPAQMREAVEKAFEIKGKTKPVTKVEALSVKLVHGYNAKRNLRNIPRSAFAMGGTFGFKALETLEIPMWKTTGQRTAEGFGILKCVTEKQVNALLAGHSGAKKDSEGIPSVTGDGPLAVCYRKKHQEDKYAQDALAFFETPACSAFRGNDITLSFIGRVMLMADQAAGLEDMKQRIAGIKDDGKMKAAGNLFKEIQKRHDDWESVKNVMIYVLRLCRYQIKNSRVGEGGSDNG